MPISVAVSPCTSRVSWRKRPPRSARPADSIPMTLRSGVFLRLILVGQDKWEEAIAACRNAVWRRPGNASDYSFLGDILRDAREAGESGRRLSQSDPARAL